MITPRPTVVACCASLMLGGVAMAQSNSGTPFLPPLNAHTPKLRHLNVQLDPVGEEAHGGPVALGGVCPQEQITYADSNFEGTFIGTLPPGMVETEVAAISITLDPSAFPVLINTSEIIFSQVHFNSTVTEWSYLVWEGNPGGAPVAEFSSDGLILPHVELPIGGAQAVNLAVTVDPGDPDQIIVNNNGSNTFSIGFRIDAHSSPPTSSCVVDGICPLPAVCCPPNPSFNAWPSMDQAGPQFPAQNWLLTRDCPGAPSFCFLGPGWFNFANPLIPSNFVNDWAIRVSYTPLSCPPGAGACCIAGECSITLEVDCTAAGGSFEGEGTDCLSADCTAGLGACCLPDDECADLSLQADCAAAGGTWAGEATDCATVTCAGACCIPATGGCVALTSADCTLVSGVFQGPLVDCGAIICFPMGACCLIDGSCLDDQSPEDCNVRGGVFQGDATTCAGTSCPEPLGACCVGGGCLELTEASCTIVAGTWAGIGTDCTDGNMNGTADDCETNPCPQDINMSGTVEFGDLLAVLSTWGPCKACPEDLDQSGDVGFADLLQVLSAWGDCP